MDRTLSLFLASALMLGLAGCGGDGPAPSASEAPAVSQAPAATLPPVSADELVSLVPLSADLTVPRIELPGPYARELNDKLMARYSEYQFLMQEGSSYLYPEQRGWAVNGEILSFWDCWLFDGGSQSCVVHNLNVRTGESVADEEVLRVAGLEAEAYHDALKHTLCSLYVGQSSMHEMNSHEYTQSIFNMQMGKGISEHTVRQASPFLDDQGRLMVGVTQYVMAGPDSTRIPVPITPDVPLPGTLTAERDDQGRLISETYRENEADQVTVRYTYEEGGVLCQEVMDPSGLLCLFRTNALDQLIERYDPQYESRARYTYHENGQIKSITDLGPDGSVRYYTEYDQNGNSVS